ncbi:MAG: FAD-dependent oxidoreductase, partial [Terriglobia bacterium]
MQPSEPAIADQTSERWDEEYDLVVLGAGAGGMTAALVGSLEGMSVLLVEKTDQVGGTTAFSSGSVWIPGNLQQESIGIHGDTEAARQYLDALIDGRAERSLRETFLAAGPKMLRYLEQRTDVRFTIYPHYPDYRQELPGAAEGGRPLEPLPFDGRTLGKHFNRVRAPLPELTLWGGMMVTRAEVARLLRLPWSWSAVALGAKLSVRYARDRLRCKRGTRLVLGNALAARLFKNLLDRDVPVWFNARTESLIALGGGVTGLAIDHDGVQVHVRARRGVVLAGGGFPASAAMRERFLPKPVAQYTAAFE